MCIPTFVDFFLFLLFFSLFLSFSFSFFSFLAARCIFFSFFFVKLASRFPHPSILSYFFFHQVFFILVNGAIVMFPLRPTRYINFSSTISLLGRWSTSGLDRGNAHFLPLQEYNRGSGRKENKRTICLGLTQVLKESYVTLCMCRLTLVWILAKLLQSYWNADSIFLHWSGPYLLPTGLSAPVSGVDCPCPWSFANCLLRAKLSSRVSLPLPVPPRSQVQKPFVWFRATIDKEIVCLADHLHSVTQIWAKKDYLGCL